MDTRTLVTLAALAVLAVFDMARRRNRLNLIVVHPLNRGRRLRSR